MSRITPDEIPVTRESLQPIRRLRGGANAGAILCGCKHSGILCVIKVLKSVKPATPPAEFLLYTEDGKLPQHERIIECMASFEHYPRRDAWTLVLPWYNAGSFGELVDEAEDRGKSIPEAFVWHVIGGVLEGMNALAGAGMAHKDLHVGNVMLHFSGPIGEEELPVVRLIDLGDQTHGYNCENSLKGDLYCFFEGIDYLTTVVDYTDCPTDQRYSNVLRNWIMLLTGQFPNGIPSPSFEDVWKDLYPEIANYPNELEARGRPTKIQRWMIRYFQRIQQKANDATALKRKYGEPVEVLDVVDGDEDDEYEDQERFDSKTGSENASVSDHQDAYETQTTALTKEIDYPNLWSGPNQQPWIPQESMVISEKAGNIKQQTNVTGVVQFCLSDGAKPSLLSNPIQPYSIESMSIHAAAVPPPQFLKFDGPRIVGRHSVFPFGKGEIASQPIFGGGGEPLALGFEAKEQQCTDFGLRNPDINWLLSQGPPLLHSNQDGPIPLDRRLKTYELVPKLESFFSIPYVLEIMATPDLDLEDIRRQFYKRLEKIRERAEADLVKILKARIAGDTTTAPSNIFWLADVSKDCYRRFEELIDESGPPARNTNEAGNVRKWEAQIGVLGRW